jgi:hypothetical protein
VCAATLVVQSVGLAMRNHVLSPLSLS